MGKIIAWLVSLWLVAGAQWAVAVKVENLYRASFDVEDQTVERREKLAAAGLARVIIKVSGSHNLPEPERLNVALAQANRYLQQFSYENAEQGYQLNLDYAKGAIDSLLRKMSLPIWPEKRPQVLLWLAQDDFQQRQMLNVSEQPSLFDVVESIEADRGLPVSLPVMDLDDRLAFPIGAAWSLNEQSLQLASSRYQSDVSLLGRMSITGSGQWLASWLFLDRGKTQLFDGRGANQEEVVADGLNQIADYLAGQHAIVVSRLDTKPHFMQLDNIDDFKSYRKVLDYLNGLAMVRHAEPELVLGKQLRLQLYIDGQLAQLVDAIALDKVLQPSQFVAEANQQGVMYYQLPVNEQAPSESGLVPAGELSSDNVLDPLQGRSAEASAEVSSPMKKPSQPVRGGDVGVDASKIPEPPRSKP